ncbi:hypothetical protein GGI35DRAFT_44848 [Trichoderma velutinum]
MFLIGQSFLLRSPTLRLEDNPGWDKHIVGTMSFTVALLLFLFSFLARRHVTTHHFDFENRHWAFQGSMRKQLLFFSILFFTVLQRRASIISMRSRHEKKTRLLL